MDDDADPGNERPWQALPREGPYPGSLEERTVSRLRAEARFGPRRSPLRAWAAAAILAAAFGAGWIAARTGMAPKDRAPRFALLLYEDGAFDAGPAGDRVGEYRAWAADLRRSGVAVTGEKLAPEFRALPAQSPAAAGERLAGFFIIGARDIGSAERIARGCPHARHGGRIVVRPVVGT